MIQYRYAIIVFLTLAGGACSELPSHDDPRDDSSDGTGAPRPDANIPEKGTCMTENYISCSDRANSQCTGGCTLTTLCHGPEKDQCALIRSPDACDGNTACRWSSGFCRLKSTSICFIYESQTACINATRDDCEWSPACDGSPMSCYQAETRAGCTALLGCKWMPD